MRIESNRSALVWAGLVALATAGIVGCGSDDAAPAHSVGSTSGGAEGGGGGGGEDQGGPKGSCIPSETTGPVDDACGVWVARDGDDGNAGLRIAPLKTLTEAIERVWYKGKRIYVCAETIEEAAIVPAGYAIYGGLDCQSDWSWIGDRSKTTLTAPEGVIPLSFQGGEGQAQLVDFHVVARSIDPAPASNLGKSSIAAVVQGVGVRFVRSTLEAGDAAPGASGTPHSEPSARAGVAGIPGNLACTSASIAGGAAVVNQCGTPDDVSDDSSGGEGGRGRIPFGGDGDFGLPLGVINRGEGETTQHVCTSGTKGNDGGDGALGAGATGHGRLDLLGYSGPWAADGRRGAFGQGGGGGGGSKGGSGSNALCPIAAAAGGASGGSGGTGGCGGLGGRGGGPGGSSIALVSLSGALQFEDTILIAGKGGSGGDGGDGQIGGAGADGALGGGTGSALALRAGCTGGPGGRGGNGGNGGGGLGGHAVGLAYTTMLPQMAGTTIRVDAAGKGGHGADAEHDGAPGVGAETYDFVN